MKPSFARFLEITKQDDLRGHERLWCCRFSRSFRHLRVRFALCR